MPNFFKNLTSSFKMNEDEDILVDENGDNMPPDQADEDDEEDKDTQSVPQENEDTEQGDDSDSPQEEQGFIEITDPTASEEKPYTIAQLAKADTAKKRKPAKARKAKTPPVNISKKEEPENNGENMPEGQLAIDVYETAAEIVIKSTIAGAKVEDLDVGIEDNVVNIRGSRHKEEKIKGENYLYQECYWGAFSRSIILPTEVDSEKAHASLKDGILTIKIPKLKKEREKKIKIIS